MFEISFPKPAARIGGGASFNVRMYVLVYLAIYWGLNSVRYQAVHAINNTFANHLANGIHTFVYAFAK